MWDENNLLCCGVPFGASRVFGWEVLARIRSVLPQRQLAGCGKRSESRCMTPFLLKRITYATNLKTFVQLPKEKPAQAVRAFSQDKLEDKLETPGGTDNL